MLGLSNNNKGETIIEVLLALAVLGLIIGIAYASANRSLKLSQDSHERTEASQLAQSTIEAIRFYAINQQQPPPAPQSANDSIFRVGAGSDFCLALDNTSITTLAAPNRYDPATPLPCTFGDGRYLVVAKVAKTSSAGVKPEVYEYTITSSWDSITGTADKNQVTMRYIWARVMP